MRRESGGMEAACAGLESVKGWSPGDRGWSKEFGSDLLAMGEPKEIADMKDTSKAAPKAKAPQLTWYKLNSSSAGGEFFKLGDVYRSKVPGGWLVMVTNNARGLMYYPDPEHRWDGGSLPS